MATIVKTRQHYLTMLENNKGASVGHTLAAYMIISGPYRMVLAESVLDEWRAISRRLKRQYGELLTPDEVRLEMGFEAATQLSKHAVRDIETRDLDDWIYGHWCRDHE